MLNSLNASQKNCIILHDREQNKKMLLHHERQHFGKSVDNPYLLDQTLLDIMWLCLNDRSKFLSKLIPISKLTSTILIEQVELTIQLSVDVKTLYDD